MSNECINQLIFQLPTIVIAALALVYSIRSYKQSHKINNENILYQEKIHAYKGITYALSVLLNEMELYLAFSHEKFEQEELSKEDKEEIRDFIDEIDEKISEFDNYIKSNAAVLPNKILNKLEDLADDLFRLEPLIYWSTKL